MTNPVFANFTYPGTKVVESTASYRSAEIASHSTIYMFGSATTGSQLEPTNVISVADFTNQFGSSGSENSLRLLFRNDPTAVVYFTRVSIAQRYTVTISSAAAGNYALNVNGTDATFAADADDTIADIRTGLISTLNSTQGAILTATAGGAADQIYIASDVTAPLTITVSSGTMTIADSTPLAPTAQDYVFALGNTFDIDDYYAQGFVICPEAFQALTLQADRTAVGTAMEALAAQRDWMALVDCAAASDTVAELQAEYVNYSASKGHLAFYAPYLTDLEDNLVPPSAAVAAVASKRYRTEGYQEPIGGASYRLAGVKGLAAKFNNTQQSILNPLGVNLIRDIRNRGFLIWGMRTRAADVLYRFVHTRVIMNTLNGSLRNGFDDFPFSAIDGSGVLLHRIEETAISICRKLYQAKALFGATEADAFAVECSLNNNSLDDLEDGNVLLAVYAAPVPGLEKLLIASYRVTLGQVQTAALAGRNVSAA